MSKFEKVLNKKDVFVIAFGAMIGWGWVVQAGEWIMQAGTLGAILSFIFGGIGIYKATGKNKKLFYLWFYGGTYFFAMVIGNLQTNDSANAV